MTQVEKTVQFYANLNRESLLTLFCTFNQIKYRKVVSFKSYQKLTKNGKLRTETTYTDNAGGFFIKSDVKVMAKEFGKNYQTFRKQIAEMVKLGWLIPTQTGYRLIGKQKMFDKYGEDLKTLSFSATSKKEVLKLSAIRFLKVNLSQQLYRAYNCPARKHKHSRALLAESDYTISVRKLQRVLGYKSPMSGLRMEKTLEKEKLITIEKRDEFLCHANDYKRMVFFDKSLPSKCFYKDDLIYKRMTNNIIISW